MNCRFKSTHQVYVIAEIGLNHNGDFNEARRLMRAANDAGADGVKFQVRDLKSIYVNAYLDNPLKAEHGTQYLLNELRRAHLSYEQIAELHFESKHLGVDFFATPFDIKSAHFLNDLGVHLFKVGSPDFTNLPLLDVLTSFKKPLILSTGMCTEAELRQVANFLAKAHADFSLLHCNSTYPASYDGINLKFMETLRSLCPGRVGYSGHEQGYAPTLAAVGLGAQIIERHITASTDQQGPDHRSSLTEDLFKLMVRDIRIVEASLGSTVKKYSQGEKNNRLNLAKSLVAVRDLPAGTVLQPGDLAAKTPAKGVSPLELQQFVGHPLARDIKADEYIFSEHMIDVGASAAATYKIPKTWGIVGRLNDFRDFLELKPDLIEIHMTWRDLVSYRAPAETFEQDLVVHAPEYFQDQLIDFTSEDPMVRDLSLEMLQKSINVARDLSTYFKGQRSSLGPRVVVHPGGHFSKPTVSNKQEQYRLLMKNLKLVDSSGVRILIENMPPLPWYFGGQWFNTVFLDPDEIAQFAREMGWGVCYDTSHAQLYCHYAGINLADFTRKIMNSIAYLHISDARGSTEEGLQIGQGDIDFEQFFAMIKNLDVGFIPEIWQGHLNKGQGFKEGLSYIQKILSKCSNPSCHINSCGEHPPQYTI